MPEKTTKKRKRESKNADAGTAENLDAMDIFRRHFESQFAPLKEAGVKKKAKKKPKVELDDEWHGLSEDEGVMTKAEGLQSLNKAIQTCN